MGLITDTERYNQVIDVWTNTNAGLTEMIMSRMKTDQRWIQLCLYDARFWCRVLKNRFVSYLG